MKSTARIRRITVLWLVLIAATVFSWMLGRDDLPLDTRTTSVVIMLIAFVKIRYVILDFMELREAPWGMRLVAEAWVLIAGTSIVGLYWL
jgi:heme/copper-type cytochrome/quinol oxidase subunit 4